MQSEKRKPVIIPKPPIDREIEDDIFYQMVQLSYKAKYYEYDITLNERYKYLIGVAFSSDNGFGITADADSKVYPTVGISKNGRFIFNMVPGYFLMKNNVTKRNYFELKQKAEGEKLKVHIKDMNVENDDLVVIFILSNKEPKDVKYKYGSTQFNIINAEQFGSTLKTELLLLENDVDIITEVNYCLNISSQNTNLVIRDSQYKYFEVTLPEKIKPSIYTGDTIDRLFKQGIPCSKKIYLEATAGGLANVIGLLDSSIHIFGFIYKYKVK